MDRIDQLRASMEFGNLPRHECDKLLDIAEALRGGLNRIAELKAGGPHLDAKGGMAAALDALDSARRIARAALAKLEVC